MVVRGGKRQSIRHLALHVGRGSPYAICICCICYKDPGAFYVRQMDSDILDSEHHPREGKIE